MGGALSWHLSEASRQGSSEWDSLVRREAAWGLVPGKRGVGEACCNSFIFHAHLPGTFWLLMPGRQDVDSACMHACTHTLKSREGDRTLFLCWVCAGRRWAWICSLSLRPASTAGFLPVGAESWVWGRKGNWLFWPPRLCGGGCLELILFFLTFSWSATGFYPPPP